MTILSGYSTLLGRSRRVGSLLENIARDKRVSLLWSRTSDKEKQFSKISTLPLSRGLCRSPNGCSLSPRPVGSTAFASSPLASSMSTFAKPSATRLFSSPELPTRCLACRGERWCATSEKKNVIKLFLYVNYSSPNIA